MVWLMNRTSTKAVDGMTPYEAAFPEKPNLGEVQEWGEKVWVRTEGGNKLGNRVHEGRWLGIDGRSKGVRIYWPDTKTVMSTEAIHRWSEPDLLLLCDDQTTRTSPQLRASSQEACQLRGVKTIAQASEPRPAMLTGEVLAKDIQYSKEACNIAITGNIKHLVLPLRLSAALGFT